MNTAPAETSTLTIFGFRFGAASKRAIHRLKARDGGIGNSRMGSEVLLRPSEERPGGLNLTSPDHSDSFDRISIDVVVIL